MNQSEGGSPVGRGHVDPPRPFGGGGGGGAERLVELEGEGGVGGLGESALLVEDGQQPHVLLEEDVQDGRVTGVADDVQDHALLGALVLLPLEDMLVEVLLQLLVGHVDAHLWEGQRGRGKVGVVVMLEVASAEATEDKTVLMWTILQRQHA